ncbi:MAG: phosphoribosylformylglycinamidine cyclo-ligase [Spirochaetales bacterium]|nr:phosphoribosylformylglycinamidine cyclo-ligase [Spirochaetales bacterium]
MSIESYAQAGVDIEKGDRFAKFIGGINSKAVSSGIGGFAGGVPLNLKGFEEPILLSATDGVGTKLMVAQKLGKFDTLGIDLVAMSANDLIVCGAMPMVFLDYIGCGKLNENILQEVVKGVVIGCEQAECTLAGGETAEMPDMYKGDDFDLAGFCVGVVDRPKMLPKKESIKAGDIIIGVASTGIHSNGLSLARKIIPENETSLMEALLTPTKIYVPELKALLATEKLKAVAHITGGGLTGNFVRVLPPGLVPAFNNSWAVPSIFSEIQDRGKIAASEMEKVFNMGIGLAMAAAPDDLPLLEEASKKAGFDILTIGEVVLG